ncbi:hypothetical protein P3T76_010600 [Phytophthora citrophthora]|uniref:Uncharacterized protein n=1 Tax=Phytophthora citrophthora TaxID=4793 RepID=A0AAD9LGA2_9STRA|nr:hypothetical protein P3T76_010600 [Phytophthora citrophthora]
MGIDQKETLMSCIQVQNRVLDAATKNKTVVDMQTSLYEVVESVSDGLKRMRSLNSKITEDKATRMEYKKEIKTAKDVMGGYDAKAAGQLG